MHPLRSSSHSDDDRKGGSRRSYLHCGGFPGLSSMEWSSLKAMALESRKSPNPIIILWLNAGWPHQDTIDPKPSASRESRSSCDPVDFKADATPDSGQVSSDTQSAEATTDCESGGDSGGKTEEGESDDDEGEPPTALLTGAFAFVTLTYITPHLDISLADIFSLPGAAGGLIYTITSPSRPNRSRAALTDLLGGGIVARFFAPPLSLVVSTVAIQFMVGFCWRRVVHFLRRLLSRPTCEWMVKLLRKLADFVESGE